MNTVLFALNGLRRHRWAMLLVAIFSLLIVSPYQGFYDLNDNFITPLVALVVLGVTLSTAHRFVTVIAMTLLTLTWLIVSIATDGSGLFAGVSTVAPLLFLVVMISLFLLLANWMTRVTAINAETLCAAVCGYLILGLFWTGIYALAVSGNHNAIASPNAAKPEHGDLIYFSYTTLTTTGFGDLIPKDPHVRMWAVMEAVAGTFYNAIVIARFVTLYGFSRPSNSL